MTIEYFCRHCGLSLGNVTNRSLHSQDLGLQTLTHEERHSVVTYLSNGDIHVKAICEHCQQTLDENPDLHRYNYFIH